MASLKPSLSSYARVSYARELLGDVRGAAQAMRLAIDSAVGQPEALAWSQTQLGKLMWSQGRVAAAEHEYRSALAVRPGYVYALRRARSGGGSTWPSSPRSRVRATSRGGDPPAPVCRWAR